MREELVLRGRQSQGSRRWPDGQLSINVTNDPASAVPSLEAKISMVLTPVEGMFPCLVIFSVTLPVQLRAAGHRSGGATA